MAIPAGTASREAAGSGEVASGEGAMEAEAVEMASGEGAAVRALSLASLLPGDGGDFAQEEEDDERFYVYF